MSSYLAHMTTGRQQLLALDIPSALASFDAALTLDPASFPKQWMRGIALFFAQHYQQGATQFTTNLNDNPDDVEEVVWACMCDMKRRGPSYGQSNILPCPTKDVRVPMLEIYRLFSGTGNIADVLQRRDDATAIAYGHLYVGLYLDCLLQCSSSTTTTTTTTTPNLLTLVGLSPSSRRHYLAASQSPPDDFMGKLATALHNLVAGQTNTTPETSPGQTLMPTSRFEHDVYSTSLVGCWQLSSGHHNDSPNAQELNRRLTTSIQRGLTSLDMGDIYTGVEEYVGQYLQTTTDVVQIHTKLVPDLHLLQEWTATHTNAIVRRSCNRLGLQQLHLVQFHWWDWSLGNHVAAYESLCALRPAMVQNVGVTNYDATRLSELLEAGLPVASNQVQYSLLDRRVERDQVPVCTTHQVRLLCYGVLAGGFLSDRWLGKPDPVGPGEHTTQHLATCLSNRSLVKYYLVIVEFGGWSLFQELLVALRTVADRHGTNIATLAQGWVLSRPCVGGVILGLSGKATHLDCARTAHDLAHDLTQEDVAHIDHVWHKSKWAPGHFYAMERMRDGVHGKIMRYNCGELWTQQHCDEFVHRVGTVLGNSAMLDGRGWWVERLLLEGEELGIDDKKVVQCMVQLKEWKHQACASSGSGSGASGSNVSGASSVDAKTSTAPPAPVVASTPHPTNMGPEREWHGYEKDME
jgi:aryl-alcohol dehydrogenase-like predicted oxidoreductase